MKMHAKSQIVQNKTTAIRKANASAGVNLGLKPIPQPNNYTCGLCSCSSVYRFYGLDPHALRLSQRLGVNKPAVQRPIPSWTPKKIRSFLKQKGTLPFEMFTTLYEDGFDITWLQGPIEPSLKLLKAHLRKGRPALALFGSNLEHWIAIGGYEKDFIRIIDSGNGVAFEIAACTGRAKQLMPNEAFAGHAVGILLLSRMKNARVREMDEEAVSDLRSSALAFSIDCLKNAGRIKLKPYTNRVGDKVRDWLSFTAKQIHSFLF